MRADRVEIAKNDDGHPGIGVLCVSEDLLHHQLGPAVGIRGSACWHGFDQRHLFRRAVNRRR